MLLPASNAAVSVANSLLWMLGNSSSSAAVLILSLRAARPQLGNTPRRVWSSL